MPAHNAESIPSSAQADPLATLATRLSQAEGALHSAQTSPAENRGQRLQVLEETRDLLRQIQEAQRRTAEIQRRVLDGLPAAIALLDSAGRLVEVNQAWKESLGRHPLLGVNAKVGVDYRAWLAEVKGVDGESAMHAAEIITRVLSGQSADASHEFSVSRDERTQWFLLRVTSLPAGGGMAGALVVHSDITERRTVEKVLRMQGDMLNQAHEAIFHAGLDGRINYWNAAAERLFGFTAKDAQGKTLEQIVRFDDLSALPRARRETMEKGEWSGELQFRRAGGGILTMEVRRTLMRDESGVPNGQLCICADITVKKKFEVQFLRAQRMESVGTLAGGIAHDLNNILAPILMTSRLSSPT